MRKFSGEEKGIEKKMGGNEEEKKMKISGS